MSELRYIVVSYYTTRPDYRPAGQRLKDSLDKFGIPNDVRAVAGTGNWRGNVCMKPGFIRTMLDQHPEAKAVVWLDADAIVHGPLDLFNCIETDFAAYWYPWRQNREEMCSGTFYVANTDAAKAAMDKWIAAIPRVREDRAHTKPEQQLFQEMLPTLGVSMTKLPQTYCFIVSKQGCLIKREDLPLIEHRQWSRHYRSGRTDLPCEATLHIKRDHKNKSGVVRAKPYIGPRLKVVTAPGEPVKRREPVRPPRSIPKLPRRLQSKAEARKQAEKARVLRIDP